MKKFMLMLLALVATATLNLLQAADAPLAFPGADGYAKHITGGRGGKVYYVTSLKDCSDDNLVPGTLRWALRTGDDTPRTILFAVNGTIYLESKLKTNHANVSILGQSAPGGGICITGYPVVVNNRNYIIRYVRFRAGDIPAIEAGGNESFSGLDVENAAEVILDHCSVTWSMEECLTMFDNDTTTVQYCIIGEGLYHSYNVKTTGDDSGRAFAMQWGGEHSNMHHTLITNCNGRGPRFNGVREANAWLEGANGKKHAHDCTIDGDFANNVFYNWGGGSLSYYGGEFYAANFANAPAGTEAYNRIWMRNNYFRPGPSTKKNGSNYRHFFHPSGDADNKVGEWYLAGNQFELSSYYTPSGTYWSDTELKKVNEDNMSGFGTSASALDLSSTYQSHILTTIPYDLSDYQPVSAAQAYQEVTNATQGAGACLPRYDEEDQRLIDEAGGRRNGVTPFQGSRATGAANRPGIIDTPTDITFANGNDSFTTAAGNTYSYYPSLAMKSGEKYTIDSDGDGMPDAYEEANGLDKSNPTDGNRLNAAGYTNLEVYLNGLADGSLQNSNYQTSADYVEPGLAVRPETVTLTFMNRDEEIEGNVPAPRTIKYGDVLIFAANNSLYREGYTMTGWTDGNMTFQFGTEYSFVQDMVLYPSMTKNSKNLSDRIDDVDIVWNFMATDAPEIGTGLKGLYVVRGKIESDSLDVKLSFDGNQLTLPSDQGATATVTYRNGTTTEHASNTSTLQISLTDTDIRQVSLSLPYIFDPTGIEFHSVTVADGKNYELIYGDTLEIDKLSWINTTGQRRNGYRNCLIPTDDDELQYTGSSLTGTTPTYGFIVGQSITSTYKLIGYIKDCARVRTYAAGSNKAGDQLMLTAIPADGSEKSTAFNLHKLNKSNSFSEYFDLELDPTQSYMLVWSSVGGNDMVVGAVKFFDKTGIGTTSGDATIQWNWDGTFRTAGQADPSKAFTAAVATSGDALYTRQICIEEEVYRIQFRQSAETDVDTADHCIEVKITPNGGYLFTPEQVSFFRRFEDQGEDTEGQIDIYFKYGNDDEQYIRQTKSTSSTEDITIKSTTASFADKFKATSRPFYVRFYIRNMSKLYGVILNDIKITGTYVQTSATKYKFSAQVTPAGSGVITQSPKGSSFVPESEISLTATPANGYQFVQWEDASGQILSTDRHYQHSKTDADEVITARFEDLTSNPIFAAGPFDAMVSNVSELQLALKAAAQSTAERYRIFVRNGEYDFGQTAMTAVPQNTSLIGESQDGVLLFNTPSASVTDYQNETPVLFIDQNQNNVYMQDLTVRQARDWAAKTSQGQALAIRQRGKQAIYKNVTLQGVQDTYYLNKADGTAYFEDCTVAGEVDFIYGDGTMFFQNCLLNPVSSNAYITAPNTQSGYKGIVFNECTIDKPADAKDAVTGYKLGRPWGDSPAATFLNTTMKVLPTDAGWGHMTEGCVIRFHEYGSKDAQGNSLDLSKRSLSQCAAAEGSDSPVLDAAQVADYALTAVFPTWTPNTNTVQFSAPTPQVSADGVLSWSAVEGAYCYAIVCDGSVLSFTTDTQYATPVAGTYAIRVANTMGGLGTAGTSVAVTSTGIENVNVNLNPDVNYFDLYGRKVNNPQSGQILLNQGKRILVK